MADNGDLVLTQPEEWGRWVWRLSWTELMIDRPDGSGVHGFMLRLGQLRVSVTLPASGRDRDADPLRPGVPGSYDGPPVDPTRGEAS
jgi:hypothetical protein